MAQQIGIGRAEWTEPYVFAEDAYGMTYVAPMMYDGHRLMFGVEVTTLTLSAAISQEIENLPVGSLWMIVTPGYNAVVSSNNETYIDDPDCSDCKVLV